MKKMIAVLLIACRIAAVHGQQGSARLVVRGDDMGYTHSGNEALIKCFKEGIETSIEVIVASPWFPEAARLLEENPKVDVGIHLALTSEWENIKWRPLSDCASIRDSNGYFFPMVFANKNYPGKSISENKWTIADVEKEFRAQIELALKKIPRISHLSSHMGCTYLSPEVTALTKKLAAEYKLPVDPGIDQNKTVGFNGPHKTTAEKIESFLQMLNKLQPGNDYVFIEHPGLDGAELRAVYHIGYEDVAADRQGVTDLFTNEQVKAAIKEKGIKLISYKELGRK